METEFEHRDKHIACRRRMLAAQDILTYCVNCTLPYTGTPTRAVCLSLGLPCPLAVRQKMYLLTD